LFGPCAALKLPMVCGAGNHSSFGYVMKELSMVFFAHATSRVVAGGIAAGAISGAMLFSAAGLATADPTDAAPAPAPPDCTAANLAGVAAGVAAATSAYLFAHPDVNDYFTSLKGQPRSDMRAQLQQYMDANPQVHADLLGIRQPLTDFRDRCQLGESGEGG
jgi:heme-binding protein